MDSSSQETETRQRRKESKTSSVTGLSITTSQRDVESLISKSDEKSAKFKSKKVPPLFSLISLIVLIGVVWLFVKYSDGRLPTPLTAADVAENPERHVTKTILVHTNWLTFCRQLTC